MFIIYDKARLARHEGQIRIQYSTMNQLKCRCKRKITKTLLQPEVIGEEVDHITGNNDLRLSESRLVSSPFRLQPEY